ncbi:MAG: response regulator transcription factor [Herbiconiux sp.]|nr:response regulator transcription factor [Herbiconiux sp.]
MSAAVAEVAAVAERIRVVVADDQELFVYGLRMLIESQPDLELVGTAGDGAEAVDLVGRTPCDVVLMDIRMPVLSGIEATRRITGGPADPAGPGPRVVVLTTFQQQEAVFLALKHGASAFVTKDVTPEVLLGTIRAVHAGDAPPASLTGEGSLGHLVRRHGSVSRQAGVAGIAGAGGAPRTSGASDPDPLAALSPREREIFVLAAKGLRNADIAAAAFVSEATVKSHVRSILAKLGLAGRAQIVVLAYESGLLG